MMKSLYLAALLGALSCGGSDGPSAPEKCEAVVTAACNRFAVCTASSDPASFGAQFNACHGQAVVTFDCTRATGVTASYQSCLDQLAVHPCALVVAGQLPASCAHVVQHP